MPDQFDKTTTRSFGARGSPVFNQEQTTTDLEEMVVDVTETDHPFCTCGAPITAAPDVAPAVYRCCSCELISCQRCIIRLRKRHFCPTCMQREFVDKHTFLTLLFIDRDRLEPDDLVDITTVGGEPVEVTIDPAATHLTEHGYLEEDGTLAPTGREALHVGHQLFDEDPDIQQVKHQLRVQEVANP